MRDQSLLIYPNFIRANQRFIDFFLISLTDFRLYRSLCAVKVLLARTEQRSLSVHAEGSSLVRVSRWIRDCEIFDSVAFSRQLR